MFMLGAHELIVGMGSSSTDALERLRSARKALRAHPAFRLRSQSGIYESDALLPAGAPKDWDCPYLNAACRLELARDLSALEVVEILKAIERDLGRLPAPRWAPRTIDLDLLAWGRESVSTPEVSVPHVGLATRAFAWLPASDCAKPSQEPTREQRAWRFGPPEQVPQRTRITSHAWPEIVGIVNLTPDSFSSTRSGLMGPPELASQIEKLATEGASIVDVGAESTRPGATPLMPEEEIERLKPVLDALLGFRDRTGTKISLDSRHPATVAWALERGLPDWINDVCGFAEPKMRELAAKSRCELVVMHSLGVPPRSDRALDPGLDPAESVAAWAEERIRALQDLGIEKERIILDPGIGFGKTAAQNLRLIHADRELGRLGCSLLIGHSRKRFLDADQRVPASERDLETAILTANLARSGADYVRVHDAGTQSRALRLGARCRPPWGPEA
jgi:2-amino-4-hydroxy-6-hydroxymethyldihydropteridine diphosphokinase/dihydropteroate synthase